MEKLIYHLPKDFPAKEYLKAFEKNDPLAYMHLPFSHVPFRDKWSMRNKVQYALACGLSINDACNLGWGNNFERTYERVCACIAFKFSSAWQEKKYVELGNDYDKFRNWLNRNRKLLGYTVEIVV